MELENKKRISLKRTEIISLLIIALLVIGLFSAVLHSVRKSELNNDSETQISILKSQNEDLKAKLQRRQPSSNGNVKFASDMTPFNIEVPDNLKIIVKQDALSKSDPTTEIELVTATESENMLSSEARFGTTVFRVHKDVFKSRDTSSWVKNETANQIDTTMLTPETFSGVSWLGFEEPNNLAGHKITYFLLKDGFGYRANFYRLGDFEVLKQFAQQTMNAVTLN